MVSLAADAPPNPWFTWDYVTSYRDEILAALEEHVILTALAVGIGLLLAFPLALLARRSRALQAAVYGVTGALYTIPALALFAFLYPVFGLARKTVVIPLVAYTLLILVRNLVTGLQGVPPETVEAARGMGYPAWRLLLRVELPLALPSILAGVRIATVSTIALVTVGAIVGNGGLGELILEGFNSNFYRAEITTACVLCVALAVAADLLLVAAQRVLAPWSRR